jgi:hypothetical protein
MANRSTRTIGAAQSEAALRTLATLCFVVIIVDENDPSEDRATATNAGERD